MLSEIIEIAVLQTGSVHGFSSFVEEYGSLVDSFPSPVRWFWLHGGGTPQGSARFFLGDHFVDPVPLGIALQNGSLKWIQDAFALRNVGGVDPVILLPSGGTEEDRAMVFALAERAGLQFQIAPFHFEGGNIVELDDFVLVGKDILLQNGVVDTSGTWVDGQLAELEGKIIHFWPSKRLIWLGFNELRHYGSLSGHVQPHSFQPLFHLDLQFLMVPVPSAPFLAVVGEVDLDYILGDWEAVEDQLWTIKEGLDLVARQLERGLEGRCQVIRIPILLAVEGKNKALRILSHCNGHAYQDAFGAVALLPNFTYGLSGDSPLALKVRELQACVVGILASHPLRCHFIDYPFYNASQLGGALHCLTKVIRHKK